MTDQDKAAILSRLQAATATDVLMSDDPFGAAHVVQSPPRHTRFKPRSLYALWGAASVVLVLGLGTAIHKAATTGHSSARSTAQLQADVATAGSTESSATASAAPSMASAAQSAQAATKSSVANAVNTQIHQGASQGQTNSGASGSTGETFAGLASPSVQLQGAMETIFTNGGGFRVNASGVSHTTDGGLHWVDVTPHITGLASAPTAAFVNGNQGYLAAVQDTRTGGATISVFRTTNGGSEWTSLVVAQMPLRAPSILMVLGFTDTMHGDLLIQPSTDSEWNGQPRVYHTEDGGQSWHFVPTQAP